VAIAETGTIDSELTDSQRERRKRIVDAAITLAVEGGYDGVQMRDVAERADVALGTLYRYFPSKVHLLVNVLHQLTGDMVDRLDRNPPKGQTAGARVLDLLDRSMRVLQREPQLADAMMRALMFADASAASEVDAVSAIMTGAITRSMHGPDREPTHEDHAIARVIENVWWAYILSWLSGRASARQVTDDLEAAVRLLVR